MEEPRDLVDRIERESRLPDGSAERFEGYGVMGLPFQSGHVLAMRRFPASSVGPGYTSVWHRDPGGRWTFYATTQPELACTRYFGQAVSRVVTCRIDLEWLGPRELRVSVGGGTLDWHLKMAPTFATWALNRVGSLLPDSLWQSPQALGALGIVAGSALRSGRVGLVGRVPNGQWFQANPRLIWTVPESTASLEGVSLRPLGPLPEQARLGDFWLPQRGILAIGRSYFEPFSPSRHLAARQSEETGQDAPRSGSAV